MPHYYRENQSKLIKAQKFDNLNQVLFDKK